MSCISCFTRDGRGLCRCRRSSSSVLSSSVYGWYDKLIDLLITDAYHLSIHKLIGSLSNLSLVGFQVVQKIYTKALEIKK